MNIGLVRLIFIEITRNLAQIRFWGLDARDANRILIYS